MAVTNLSTIHKTIKALKPKYPYVFAWFDTLGHPKPYIAWQLKIAHTADTSRFSVYQKENGTWINVKSLSPSSIKTLHETLPTKLVLELSKKFKEKHE